MVQVYPALGVQEPFDAELSWVTSWAFPPRAYAGIRLLLAVYTLVSALVDVALTAKAGGVFSYYSFFTNLSYIGLVSWFWASGVQTSLYAFREGRKGYPLQRWPRFLRFLHSLLFSTVAVYPIIVLIVVWAILYNPKTYWATTYSSWEEVSVHMINAVLAMFEVIFSNIAPMPWWHMLFIVIGLALYLGVAYITRASQGFYTYSFLNPATEKAKLAGYIIGIGIGGCLVFILIRYIIVLRVWLTRGRRERTGEVAGHVKQVDDGGEKA
ncbi:hypothetical protein CALVIDRAFT_597332 [Calocera viscosa TUFC12733]|uniref:FAR-17a/AIG1-like protein n=1 Tax=Calocera viscosa (strain TUFC12733) TaxID=1330018 RepID=A0A167NMM1_CALVF|nr:hypothetical protein CALVIDRAFT_597332 [Calocera viscosa TUFC12733]